MSKFESMRDAMFSGKLYKEFIAIRCESLEQTKKYSENSSSFFFTKSYLLIYVIIIYDVMCIFKYLI